MRKLRLKIIIRNWLKIFALFFFVILATACIHRSVYTNSSTTPNNSIESKLNKAGEEIGRTIPIPTYFPQGYKIDDVEITERDFQKTIILNIRQNISQSPLNATANAEITLQIEWHVGGPLGIKLMGQKIDITGSDIPYETGIIVEKNDRVEIWWDLFPDEEWSKTGAHFEFLLTGNNSVPLDVLIQIARSIKRPFYTAISMSPKPIP